VPASTGRGCASTSSEHGLASRATERPTTFNLLIPNVDPNRAADWSLGTATKLLGRAAVPTVQGHVGGEGGEDPFQSIKTAVAGGTYDDILISTLPKRRSDWLRKDLPTRVEALGLPVNVITPPEEPSALQQFTDTFSAGASE
jgi:hypothetical protein